MGFKVTIADNLSAQAFRGPSHLTGGPAELICGQTLLHIGLVAADIIELADIARLYEMQ